MKLNGRARHGTSAGRACGKKARGVPWTQVAAKRVPRHEGGGSFVAVELIGHLLLADFLEEVNV